MSKGEIYFEATYNPHKKVILVDGDGAAEIKFTTDATQLASVLSSLAQYKGCRIGIRLKSIPDAKQNDSRKSAKTLR